MSRKDKESKEVARRAMERQKRIDTRTPRELPSSTPATKNIAQRAIERENKRKAKGENPRKLGSYPEHERSKSREELNKSKESEK